MDKLLGKCQCEKLQKQLKRYETKFSDLVSSYKTIIEEKKVLEATLKTLSSSSTATCSSANKAASGGDAGDGLGVSRDDATTGDDQTSDPNEGESNSSTGERSPDEDHIRLLEEKISMLSKALNSVTEGKANMEAAFKGDRKAIIGEHSMTMEKVLEEKANALQLEEETRAKLRQEQLEREDESKAHSLMLKELQEILAAERSEKDVLKLILHEKELSNVEQKQLQEIGVNTSNYNAEAMQARLTSQFENQQIVEEEESDENERAEADQQRHEITLEQMRASHVEEILADRQIQEERRIVELESRLSELSDVVGNYDRKRQEDQVVIRKLRERLENLEKENSELSNSQSSGNHTKAQPNTKSEKLYNSQLAVSLALENVDSPHLLCQEEYRQLQEEFDQYKKKSKYRATKEKTSEEITEYKKRICRLEKEIDRLKVYYDEKERTNVKIISGLQIDVTRSKEEFEEKAENINQECKLSIQQMECEMRKQRARTVEVIADRDREIEMLQNKLYDYSGPPKESSSPQIKNPSSVVTAASASKPEDLALMNEILVHSPSHTGSDGLFYFTQQVAHYDAELYTCRMQILDLESQVRDFEKREEQLLVQMQALKEEIRSLERSKSRESANLEYLKNITLQYMLTDSLTVKSQMSLAISTVLMFSPDEMARVRKRLKGGWW